MNKPPQVNAVMNSSLHGLFLWETILPKLLKKLTFNLHSLGYISKQANNVIVMLF